MRAKIILVSFLLSVVWLSGCDLSGGLTPPQPLTPEHFSRNLVDQLNAYMINEMDPVGYVIDAKFQALDAYYTLGNENALVKLEVKINSR